MAKKNFNWVCPHCDTAQTVVDARYDLDSRHLDVAEAWPRGHSLESLAICCSNTDCQKITLSVSLAPDEYVKNSAGGYDRKVNLNALLATSQIYPSAKIKAYPDYIPGALREDYVEACKIADLSAKAAATLARRCLQGMIRDFAGIQDKTLFKEIDRLRKSVDDGTAVRDVSADSLDAIDAVRKVGNIGAHMEADIDLIVPVDPDEAKLLIQLIETLFDEWYVARHKRIARFAKVKELADAKQAIKDAGVIAPK